ncbi:MAG TPA: hypothetical protein VHG28_21450 [Longimicrobiaceae bacterium]|nr:hypothetical protein [Longimicrobiaceae bacterium]
MPRRPTTTAVLAAAALLGHAPRALPQTAPTVDADVVVYPRAPGVAWVYDARPELAINVQEMTPREVRLLRDAGIRLVRMSIWWAWHRPELWDRMMRLCDRNGISVMPLITAPPQQYNRSSVERFAPVFARFTADVLRRYPSIRYVQLLNEMDTGSPWFGPESGRPLRERGRAYGRFLRLVYPVLKAANPNVWVVTGGMSDTGDFVRGIYEAGARNSFDVLAIHVYGDHVWGEPWGRGDHARRVMRAFDDERKPLWVTEFGMSGGKHYLISMRETRRAPSARDLDAYQLENWRRPLEELQESRRYQKVFGFQLPPGDETRALIEARGERFGMDHSFGIVRMDGSPRPTYTWLRERQYNAPLRVRRATVRLPNGEERTVTVDPLVPTVVRY